MPGKETRLLVRSHQQPAWGAGSERVIGLVDPGFKHVDPGRGVAAKRSAKAANHRVQTDVDTMHVRPAAMGRALEFGS